MDKHDAESEGNRIRAFLATVKFLDGCEVVEDYWEGRSLIERLALVRDLNAKNYHWDAIECATVLDFLHWIQPVKGSCFCNDDSELNATCGFHAVLEFLSDEVRRMGKPAKPKRARASDAEVAHHG
jgi:hypothetical protein